MVKSINNYDDKYKRRHLSDEIAIIGIGVNYPFADTVSDFWDCLVNHIECPKILSLQRRKDLYDYFHYIGEEDKKIKTDSICFLRRIDEFDYKLFHISPKEARSLDPNQRLFLEVTYRAVEDAGFDCEQMNGTNTGVYVGYSPGAQYVNELNYAQMTTRIDSSSVNFIGNSLSMAVASRVSYVMNLKGPAMIVDTACSSSLVAVHLAIQALKNNECEMAVAGGVRLFIGLLQNNISTGIESKSGGIRVFDDSADGTIAGEGAAAILLKPLKKALKDGNNIYAIIKGSAMNQDGTTMGITVPNPEAQEKVIVQAWKNAGINPESIKFIETHGTGTKLGDPIELLGIERAFRRYTSRMQFCAIGSVKSNMGHLDYAAGITGLIKSALSIKNRAYPATINFKNPNRNYNFETSPVYINNKFTEFDKKDEILAGVSAFGLGGTNCHVVLVQDSQLGQNEIHAQNMISLHKDRLQRERCWLTYDKVSERLSREEIRSNYFYRANWHQSLLDNEKKPNYVNDKETIVFACNLGNIQEIISLLQPTYPKLKVFWVDFQKDLKYDNNITIINEEDYKRILELITSTEINIIHLCSLVDQVADKTIQEVDNNLNRGVYSLFHIVKSLNKKNNLKINLKIVTNYSYEITKKEECILPEHSALIGFAKTIQLEENGILCSVIDIDKDFNWHLLVKELEYESHDFLIAYRSNQRYKQIFEKVDISFKDNLLEIDKKGDIILIAGGLGGLGLEIIEFFAKTGGKHFIILSRTKFPNSCQWETLADIESNKSEIIKHLLLLKSKGNTIDVIQADISKEEDMEKAFLYIYEKYSYINIVINCAGIIDVKALRSGYAKDGYIAQKDINELKNGIAAKIHGTWLLDKYTERNTPRIMILFSSIASVFGTPGQCAYASGNSYLDAFQAKRNKDGKRTLSINWTSWREVGIGAKYGKSADGSFKLLSTAEAITAFQYLLHTDETNVVIGKFNTEYKHNKIFEYVTTVSEELKNNKNLDNSPLDFYTSSEGIIFPSNKMFSTENKLCKIISLELGYDILPTDANFYKLGGDSITAARVAEHINRELNVKIDAYEVLKYPMIQDLTKKVLGILNEDTAPKESPVSINDTLHELKIPLSELQKQLYYISKYDPESTVYNLPVVEFLQGSVDRVRFEKAFQSLIENHEALRTSFTVSDNQLVQVVHPTVDSHVQFLIATEDSVDKLLQEHIKSFDLEKAPLLRILLITLSQEKHILIFDIHHIISDGISTNILIKDFIRLYDNNEVEYKGLQYKDYIMWQISNRSKLISEYQEYWKNILAEPIIPLNFPTDYPRSNIHNFEGRCLEKKLPINLSQDIKTFAIECDVTLFMLLISVYGILLYRYTCTNELFVGTSLSGRTDKRWDNTVGAFVKSLPVRLDMEDNMILTDFLNNTKESVFLLYKNQDYPLDKLAELIRKSKYRSTNYTSLFDTMFIYQNLKTEKFKTSEFDSYPYYFKSASSKFDFMMEAKEMEGSIHLLLEYNTTLFKYETMDHFMNEFIYILSIIIHNKNRSLKAIIHMLAVSNIKHKEKKL